MLVIKLLQVKLIFHKNNVTLHQCFNPNLLLFARFISWSLLRCFLFLLALVSFLGWGTPGFSFFGRFRGFRGLGAARFGATRFGAVRFSTITSLLCRGWVRRSLTLRFIRWLSSLHWKLKTQKRYMYMIIQIIFEILTSLFHLLVIYKILTQVKKYRNTWVRSKYKFLLLYKFHCLTSMSGILV